VQHGGSGCVAAMYLVVSVIVESVTLLLLLDSIHGCNQILMKGS
jgi:hypothetical protein